MNDCLFFSLATHDEVVLAPSWAETFIHALQRVLCNLLTL